MGLAAVDLSPAQHSRAGKLARQPIRVLPPRLPWVKQAWAAHDAVAPPLGWYYGRAARQPWLDPRCSFATACFTFSLAV